MSKKFTCYLCEQEKDLKHKGLSIGSGVLTNLICKACSRSNYVIYGSDEYLELSNKPEFVWTNWK